MKIGDGFSSSTYIFCEQLTEKNNQLQSISFFFAPQQISVQNIIADFILQAGEDTPMTIYYWFSFKHSRHFF